LQRSRQANGRGFALLPAGLEQDSITGNPDNALRASAFRSAAQSGAVPPDVASIDPDLAKIIDTWPTLPAPVRAAMLALVANETSERK
jgi:hypothetical protein